MLQYLIAAAPVLIQDPELWGSLSAALRVAVKAAAPDEVEITLCCFSTLLQTPGGGGKAALLVSFCLPHITAALRVVPPTHPLVPLLLHGVLNCFLVPQLSPQVHEHPKMLLQLGESLQAVFASDAVTAEVQQLALQLLQQLFSSLPETCKVIFVEEICIVDWLLETARNGKSVAQDAVQCLQQNIFASPAFLPHHLDTSTHAFAGFFIYIHLNPTRVVRPALQPSIHFCASPGDDKVAVGLCQRSALSLPPKP